MERLLIKVNEQGFVEVLPVRFRAFKLSGTSQGFIVWGDGTAEAWRYLPPGGEWSQPRLPTSQTNNLPVFDDTRSIRSGDQSRIGRRLTAQMVQLLGQTVSPNPSDDPTGIPQIDEARRAILCGNWDDALQKLNSDNLPEDMRTRGLATLYRAAILSESGLATERETVDTYRKAIDELSSGKPVDLYLAHNLFGNSRLNQAQDCLHNLAFRIATGHAQPVLAILTNWCRAEQQYRAALKHVDESQLIYRAAVHVNQAHLYALLADIIRTLDVATNGTRRFANGEQATREQALRLLAKVGSETSDPFVLASAAEVQAHLSLRAGDASGCREHANIALHAYLVAGSMPGVDGVERLLGVMEKEIRAAGISSNRSDETSRQDSLRHFSKSREAAEILRERIPKDGLGVRKAGFFARRAYVNEQIIELLVQDGEAVEALLVAEAAKARSLNDLLMDETSEQPTDTVASRNAHDARSLKALLDHWPPKTVALEFHIGFQKTWLFVVNGNGQVTVFDLLAAPRESRDLVADVQRILNATKDQSARMRQELDGHGLDHHWQDALHSLAQDLLPKQALVMLNEADTVVVVPHHILHYLPFAALVTQRDDRKRGPNEMVQPQFLIDQKFALVYAPSLDIWNRLRRRSANPIQSIAGLGIVKFPSAQQLPGVEQDLENLKATFGAKVDQVRFADEASETDACQLLARPGMVFFATHGANRPDRPLDSYLLCSKDAWSDGRLTAAELFRSTIRSDLVVLSTCGSGLADRSPLPGDDLFGIQRALLQSGARTVVSGMWDVYDGTGPILMQGFFDELAQGQTAPAALASSQRAFLKDCRTSDGDPWLHPYFWAVYTATGDDRTCISSKK